MIDKNGRLFGKINIIDLLIILVIVAALVLLAARAMGGNGGEAGGGDRVRITFFGDYVSDYLPESVSIGDPVTLYSEDTDLGTLVSFETEQGYELIYDESSGEFVKKPTLNHVWMTFTCETTGAYGAMGFKKGDTTFVVGGNYYINIGPTRTGCQIKSFEVLD